MAKNLDEQLQKYGGYSTAEATFADIAYALLNSIDDDLIELRDMCTSSNYSMEEIKEEIEELRGKIR